MSKRRTSNIFIVVAGVLGVLVMACLAVMFLLYPSKSLTTLTVATSALQSTSVSEVSQVPAANKLPSWLKLYFTNPNPPDDLQNGIDRFVVSALSSAKRTVDVASFDFNLPSVVDALIQASQRGVQVRVVVDQENGNQVLPASQSPTKKEFDAVAALKAAHIPVIDGGRSNGLMHDKFIIIDGQTLFMGSWNMSYNDTFRNNNNLLQIIAPQLIANYQAKFDEMFIDQNFGVHAVVKALHPHLILDGVQVENYFSPPDEVTAKLVDYVNAAKKSLRFMAFTYTDKDLSDAMIARSKAGISVEGVIENRGASRGALVPLFCAGLPIKTDGNKYTMHHKVIIIDESIVITGSFNFTESADKANDDNVLIIHSPAVAAQYLEEFQRVYGIGETPQAADINC